MTRIYFKEGAFDNGTFSLPSKEGKTQWKIFDQMCLYCKIIYLHLRLIFNI